jgi:hypothetical protein
MPKKQLIARVLDEALSPIYVTIWLYSISH